MNTGAHVIAMVILMTSVKSHARMIEPLEGDCNRFVYEYKLMERLVVLERENNQLKERLDKLEQRTKPIQVAVKVGLSANQNVANKRVMYDTVTSNVGDAYDLHKGHFNAPVSGVYMVVVQACLGVTTQWIDLNIVKDGAIIGRVFSGDRTFHSCGSDALSLHLDKGNKIWVVRAAGTANILNQDHGWNSFAAVLIQQDV